MVKTIRGNIIFKMDVNFSELHDVAEFLEFEFTRGFQKHVEISVVSPKIDSVLMKKLAKTLAPLKSKINIKWNGDTLLITFDVKPMYGSYPKTSIDYLYPLFDVIEELKNIDPDIRFSATVSTSKNMDIISPDIIIGYAEDLQKYAKRWIENWEVVYHKPYGAI